MRPTRRPRGQAHTLEGVTAGLLLVLALLLSLQASVATPLTASTASQHLGNQLQGEASGLVSTTHADGQLRETLLYWNETEGTFHGTGAIGFYASGGPPTAFGERLNETFEGDVAYTVDLHYVAGGNLETRTLVRLGTPADNAVTVTRTVTLYDGDRLGASDGGRTETELGDAATFFAPDAAPDGPLYNVVDVEVVVWQI